MTDIRLTTENHNLRDGTRSSVFYLSYSHFISLPYQAISIFLFSCKRKETNLPRLCPFFRLPLFSQSSVNTRTPKLFVQITLKQTVKTQIRLLLEDQILHCLPFCLHHVVVPHYSKTNAFNIYRDFSNTYLGSMKIQNFSCSLPCTICLFLP